LTPDDRRKGRRVRPWSTFELAQLLDISPRTVARWIDDGVFGPEGIAWYWTKAGPGKGSRKVRARYVEQYLQRNA